MEIMGAVERPMMEYSLPTADGTISSIVKPSVEANNFEIKPSIIQIIRSSVQFYGLPDEDPNKHLMIFLEICDTFRFNGVSNDAVDLGFSHSHYVILLKTGFSLYLLLDRESLYDAWERFKSMLRKCPHYELPVWRRIDAVSALSAQMNALTHKVDNLGAAMWNGASMGPCGACGQMGHLSQDCQVQPPQEKKINIEDVLSKFITAADTRFQSQDTRLQSQDARLQSQEALIRNIEVQIGQLVSMVSGRREGQLPSDTEKNPREQVNAIFVRNERAIGDEPPNEQVQEAQAQKEEESQEETKESPLKLNLDAIPPYIHIPKEF
ncbi:UNVERIFIED_CONTAM: hypothetical protein Slati_0223500 [Sesamum latifolium]|uniref:CCHC-type domain-containing protein n=1 Tax=Sesamum latifolium TaxID=2727402 RepID=A0AAW2YC71_9LAMI